MSLQEIAGLVGRDEFVDVVARELRKERHVVLTGPVGVGKSAVLDAVLTKWDRRRGDRREHDPEDPQDDDAEIPEAGDRRHDERRQRGERRQGGRHVTLVYVADHQAKGQFIAIARRLLEAGILPPKALDLPERYNDMPAAEIEWAKIKRHVNRLSIRDLTAAIIPAIHDHEGRILIAVDDMTQLTPTMVAFWLAVLDKAQVIGCAVEKKRGLAKLWWKMTEVPIPPLPLEACKQIVRTYIQKTGMLIESPDLYVSHVVKQANGNPQAIEDMLTDSGKERVVDKQKIREMRHAAGVRYVDFTPVMIVGMALVIGARYLAIGLGDTALYILAGMTAAVVLSLRFFLFRGAGKAS